MKVTIEQKLVDVTTYVAFDGTLFSNECDCLVYEKAHTPLYKRLAVSQELASYYPEYEELHSAKCEDSDITESLFDYTQAVVDAIFEKLQINAPKSKRAVYEHLGLVI